MKKILVFSICLFAITIIASGQHNHGGSTDQPGVHGMLIFGRDVFYASHLPLFGHALHGYQGIFRLTLDAKSAKLFQKDQQLHPEHATYTIEPETFVLPDMAANPRPFKAKLYRGHFERGGELIASSVQISIQKVVLFKKFDPATPRAGELKYLIVGSGKERFAVHLLSNKPDFEQVMQVKTDLGEGVEFVFPQAANEVPGVSGNKTEVRAGQKKVVMTLLRQIYLEFDDLR